MGALDENGVYIYDEEEPAAPGGLFSELLNKAPQSISAQLGLLSGRITALELLMATTQSESSGIITPEPGWDISAVVGYKLAGFGVLSFTYERTGSTISVPTGGNIVNVSIGSLAAGWRGVATGYPPFATTSGGRLASAYLTGGDMLRLGAVSPGGDITTGEPFTAAGVYVLA